MRTISIARIMWRFWLVPSFLFILVSGQFHCNLKKTEESPVEKYLVFKGIPRTVVLESSQRKFHQITTRILKIFLEKVLLYPNVTIVTKDDNFDNATLIFERLFGYYGDELPETMINLEVWNPPNDNIINAELSTFVSDLGISGPPTRFGWFTPKSLLHLVPGMDIWRSFRTPESTKYYRLPERYRTKILESIRDKKSNRYFCEEPFCSDGIFSPEKCVNVTCATLLAGYFETTGFVIEHIRKLQLYVEVIWVGPQLEELVPFLTHELTIHNQTSLIFLSWTPSFIVMPNNETYSTIAFPPCEELDSSLMYCKYDLHKVIKLVWAKLKLAANPVYQLLTQVSFTLKEYEEFFQIYQNETKNNTRQDEVMDRVACHWMKTHSNNITTWKNKITFNNELYIAGIFPLTGSNYNMAGSISEAAALATEAVNKSKILEGYELKLVSNDGMCQPDVVMKAFINYVMQNRFKQLVGILGPACSDTVEPLAGVSRHFHTVVISYSAEGSSFSDRKKYPYFFRTIGENNQYQQVYLQLLQHLKWAKIGALAEDGHKYSEYLSHMQLVLKKNNITFEFNNKFPPQGNIENIKQYLQEMVQENIRIIIGDVYDDVARTVMCIAYQMGMTAHNSYVWFLPSWLSSDWYDTDKYNKKNNESVECSTEQMVMAINGYFSLSHAPFGPEDSFTHENITVKQWKENFMKSGTYYSTPDKISDYAGYAYDAVWMYAYALRKLYDENSAHLSVLHHENTTKRLVEILKETNFQGVSGTVQFRGRASRISVVHVNQWYFNKSTDKVKSIVGIFEPNNSINNQDPLAGKLKVDDYLIHWLTPDGEIPKDGMIPPPRCLVEGFKNLLGVKDCEIAIVIANVMGFLFIGSILLIVFIRFYQIKKDELEKIKNNNDVLNIASKLDKWEIARVNVVINRKIGEGAFGYVYGGEAFFDGRGWVPAAVKTLKIGSTSEEKLDFLSEAEIMKQFDHKNIIKLMAVCTKNEPVYTVMEFMLYGDLKTFLLARRHLVNDKDNQYGKEANEVSSKKLTIMALDVARALSYLAEMKFVHRDVACRNALVSAQKVVKLGDFGMTRLMSDKDYYKFNRKGMLPVRWMSPESLALGIFTPSSDVWSYGVLLYEIVTFGSFPFQGMSNFQVLEHVKAGNTLKIPSGVKPQLEGLIGSCWNVDDKKRPKVSEIVEFLANNPQLLTPCLDVPISSVQIEDSGIGDPILTESLRKFSLPTFRHRTNSTWSQEGQWTVQALERGTSPQTWTYNGSAHQDIPLTKLSPLLESRNDNSWNETTEPLLEDRGPKYVIAQPMRKNTSSTTFISTRLNRNSSQDSLI